MENTIFSGKALACAWLGELCPLHVSQYIYIRGHSSLVAPEQSLGKSVKDRNLK